MSGVLRWINYVSLKPGYQGYDVADDATLWMRLLALLSLWTRLHANNACNLVTRFYQRPTPDIDDVARYEQFNVCLELLIYAHTNIKETFIWDMTISWCWHMSTCRYEFTSKSINIKPRIMRISGTHHLLSVTLKSCVLSFIFSAGQPLITQSLMCYFIKFPREHVPISFNIVYLRVCSKCT